MFGKSLQQAQVYYLNVLKPNDRVLILGGGSGDFLLALLKQHSNISVDYIDISPKMIELAKKKTSGFSNVNFIIGTEETIPEKSYSVVVTNFYLDLFPDQKLSHVIQTINNHVTSGTRWLVTDFVEEKRWHKSMLWIMYRFFRITTNIEASQLPDWHQHLLNAGLHEADSKKFYKGFIKTAVYKKAD